MATLRSALSAALLLLLLTSAACTATRHRPAPGRILGATASLPLALAPQDPSVDPGQGAAPGTTDTDSISAPFGAGIMFSPSDVLLGGAVDFPIDENLTFGPAVQIGVGDDFMVAPFGQAKFFFRVDDESGQPLPILPFAQAGVGFAYVDRDGRSSDTGLLLNVGGGLRYWTGSAYRLGTQVLLNFAPDDIAGDDFWVTWEIVQVVVDF